jgi:hypothetical protein
VLADGLREKDASRLFRIMEEIREAQLDEDHHTRVRYLSWLKKVENKWERQTATLHAGESHPILEAQKSLEKNSRLT